MTQPNIKIKLFYKTVLTYFLNKSQLQNATKQSLTSMCSCSTIPTDVNVSELLRLHRHSTHLAEKPFIGRHKVFGPHIIQVPFEPLALQTISELQSRSDLLFVANFCGFCKNTITIFYVTASQSREIENTKMQHRPRLNLK